ncbi:MAG: type VI secretion system baseplate subunit TssG [Pasteurella sp.]|nr:type VI secretion system baseplate subunit TssG [Pasteurella sp.]
MDITDRQTTNYLIEYQGNKKSANFFQLVESLSAFHDFDLSKFDEANLDSSIFLFATNPSMGFPASDIEKIELIKENKNDTTKQYRITTNFLGLQGTTSPLPGVYLDSIASEYIHGTGIKHHYFDFFNHRLTVLFIKAWRKYRYYINYKYGIDDVFSKRLFAFIGVGDYIRDSSKSLLSVDTDNGKSSSLEDIDWHKLLYFMGVLLSRVRSPHMIENIIMHYFNLKKVNILEWQKQQISIPDEQKNSLGKNNMTLSDNFMIGENVISYSKKYVLVLDDLSLQNFYDFLPTGRKNLVLKKLMTFLMKDLLPYDIHLGINLEKVPDFILGNEQHSLLGWTTFMNEDGEAIVASHVTIVGQA